MGILEEPVIFQRHLEIDSQLSPDFEAETLKTQKSQKDEHLFVIPEGFSPIVYSRLYGKSCN